MSTHYQIDPVLVERFAHGNGTVFVGAGISLGARLPSWAKLMDPLRNDLGKAVGPGASFLDIAELYETKHSRGVLIQYLKDRLGDVRFQLTQTHELIVSLPVQRIYTTNFDNLLEQASRKKQINRNVIFNASHVGFSDTSTLSIVKLHGDLDDADSLVISAKDYYRYFSRNPAVADLLKVELQTHTVLFLGYSFSDPDLGMILGKVAAQSGSVRPLLYSLQLRPEPLAVQALHERGVKVIGIDAEPGTTEANEQIENWLRCFRKALIRYDRRKSAQPPSMDGLRNRFAPPQVAHSIFRSHTRGRIDAGLQSDFRVLMVKGEAGVGKTMLVAAAVADCVQSTGVISVSDAFERVIWVSCDGDFERGPKVLERILDTIAISLDAFSIAETADGQSEGRRDDRLKKKRLRVNQLLQEHKVIVVLEDLEADATEVKDWLENAGPYANPKSRVVVTSRDAAVTGFVVEVERLSRSEAIDMVYEYARALMLRRALPEGLGTRLPGRIADETGGNPQAIRMAVGLINGTGSRDAANVASDPGTIQPCGRDIIPLFSEYTRRAWVELGNTVPAAHAVLSAMLAFPSTVAVPSRLLRKAAALDDDAFRAGAEAAARFGILERDVASDTFNMQDIPRVFLDKMIDGDGSVDRAGEKLADHLLSFLGDENVLYRVDIDDPYWNTLVRAEMAKVDPFWPIISHVMRRAAKKGKVSPFVMLLTHYMDSRFLNSERVEFIGNALVELHGRDPHMEAILRIDALAWTYIEEGMNAKARAEVDAGLRLLPPGKCHDLRALADAWRALLLGAESKFVEAVDMIASAVAHARKVESKYWIRMRVEMMSGDVQMMQQNAKAALAHYIKAERLTERYGGEGNGYQTAPRIGFALLRLKQDERACRLFRMLADNGNVATGRLYGEYGLALIAVRAEATQEAARRLRAAHLELARRGSGNVLMVLAKSMYKTISDDGIAIESGIV